MKKLFVILLAISTIIGSAVLSVNAAGKAKVQGGGTFHLILKYDEAWIKNPMYTNPDGKKHDDSQVYSMAASMYDENGVILSMKKKSGTIRNNFKISCSTDWISEGKCGYHVVKIAESIDGPLVYSHSGKDIC